MSRNILESAERYLIRDRLSLVPLSPSTKLPVCKWKPYQEAPPVIDKVREWFGNGSGYNVGIVTGEVSGIVVLDVDVEGALDGYPSLPETPYVTTGKGRHYYFKHPGYRVPSPIGFIPGVDLRGDGAQAVAPPSLHVSGRCYEWVVPFDRNKLADLPQWLIDAAGIDPNAAAFEAPDEPSDFDADQRTDTSYCAGWFKDVTKLADMLPNTGRNNYLRDRAREGGNLVAGGLLNRGEAETALYDAATASGLGQDETRDTIKSGFDYGLKLPRVKVEREDARGLPTQLGNSATVPQTGPFILTPASKIKAKRLNWLWDNVLVRGAYNCISGDPKQGKGLTSFYIAAVLSNGGVFPRCKSSVQRQGTILFNMEEQPHEIVPKLQAVGANMEMVFIPPKERSPDLRHDIEHLRQTILQHGNIGLVVFDPIVSYIGTQEWNDAGAVRPILEALNNLAAETNTCILGIHHNNKNQDASGLYRAAGAAAFTQVPRSNFTCKKNPTSETFEPIDETGVMSQLPSNHAGYVPGFAYTIKTREIRTDDGVSMQPYLVWRDHEEVLVSIEERNSTVAFIFGHLSKGPMLQDELLDLMDKEPSFSRATFFRWLRKLNIEKTNDEFGARLYKWPEGQECP